MLLAIFLLSRSFVAWKEPLIILKFAVIFYFAIFALATSNIFFAASFIFVLSLVFLMATVVLVLGKPIFSNWTNRPLITIHIRRILYIILCCLLLLYVFMFYIYPLALKNFLLIKTLADQVALVILGAEQSAVQKGNFTSPSVYLSLSWLSPTVFLLLTLFDWLVLGISFLVVLRNLLGFLRKKSFDESTLPELFLLLLYIGFGIQMAGAVVADRSNFLSGNLQIRLFTPLMLMALPLAAQGVYRFLCWLREHARPLAKLAFAASVLMASWFSIAALLKSTNEPLLNNQMLFADTPELAAGNWTIDHTQDPIVIWTGVNTRISFVLAYHNLTNYETINRVQLASKAVPTGDMNYYLMSDLERYLRLRSHLPEPVLDTNDLVYDNGMAQIYHRYPLTPYQR